MPDGKLREQNGKSNPGRSPFYQGAIGAQVCKVLVVHVRVGSQLGLINHCSLATFC
jgi:hypothetical protein